MSEFSSNLARQRIFPAWMQEIVKNLTSDEPLPASSHVGEPVTDEVWKSELDENPLRKPSGEPLEVKAEALGERVGHRLHAGRTGLLHDARRRSCCTPTPSIRRRTKATCGPIDRALLPEQLEREGADRLFRRRAARISKT